MRLAVASEDVPRAMAALETEWLQGLEEDQVRALAEAQARAGEGEPACPACGSPFSPDEGRCPDCGLNFA